jgi:hypothetical protein
VLRADPALTIPGTFHDLGVNASGGSVPPIPADVASCAQLATVPGLGRCPAAATAAAIPGAFGPDHGIFLYRDGFTSRFIEHGACGGTPMAAIAWNAAIIALNDGELPCSGGERRILMHGPGWACRTCWQSRIMVIS